MQPIGSACLQCGFLFLAAIQIAWAAPVFRVGTYNLNNYLHLPTENRPAKTSESKAKIRETLHRLNADVVALQEMGAAAALEELRLTLRSEGLHYPYWEQVTGFDTPISLAVLSRFPITARRPHTNDSFLLYGRRFHVTRGFCEVDIEVSPHYHFTLLTAHLKSRRAVPYGDETDLREQEALILREKINAILAVRPQANLVVCGDFNDTKDSKSLRILKGRGAKALTDTRPAEANGDNQPNPNPLYDPSHITWTHYYGKEDTYSRIDYLLLTPGMSREWIPQQTQVLALPNWSVASDHRALFATFHATER